jgi:uroporphyrinogen-III decarboxylase
MAMTSKQRLLAALDGGVPDRLPVTTHHVMVYFLKEYMGGITDQEFFDYFGLDPITWSVPYAPDVAHGQYLAPLAGDTLAGAHIATDQWRIEVEEVPGERYRTTRYRFVTPEGQLTMAMQSNEHTAWSIEPLVKRKADIDLIAKYCPAPKCDVEAVNRTAEAFGQRGLVRGHVCCFDFHGQPGCWQDAACLVGTEALILATFDDPAWVHELLAILQARKWTFVESLQGARYDVLELGGGAASSTVISPSIFDQFVAPYDAELIALAHRVGQRIVYHTCGGMMPILEHVAAMEPDAMETFTPPGMGGDVDLAAAKQRIGDRVCMIGGFDQFHYLTGCTPEQTRAEVRRCFAAAGVSGGYILSPSDHFFDADLELLRAYADEAQRCVY